MQARRRAVVRLQWQEEPVPAGAPFAYGVAGVTLLAGQPIAALGPYAMPPPAGPLPEQHPSAPAPSVARCVFDSPAPLGGRQVGVRVEASADGYRVEVAGLPPFVLTRDGAAIVCTGEIGATDADVLEEALLGPVLVLALALRGTFILHASAVAAGGRAAAFAGESGAGKSTMARELPQLAGSKWARLADDLVPLAAIRGRVQVLPRYPQLKVASGEQPLARRHAVPLGALYLLMPKEADEAGRVTSERLAPAAAMAAIAAQTVAARLFDPPLLAAHLDFCSAIAGAVPVRTLAFPRRLGSLPEVLARVAEDFGD